MQLSRYDEAAERFRQALTGYREIGDRAGAARALGDIGWTHAQRGRYPEALGHYRQALADLPGNRPPCRRGHHAGLGGPGTGPG